MEYHWYLPSRGNMFFSLGFHLFQKSQIWSASRLVLITSSLLALLTGLPFPALWPRIHIKETILIINQDQATHAPKKKKCSNGLAFYPKIDIQINSSCDLWSPTLSDLWLLLCHHLPHLPWAALQPPWSPRTWQGLLCSWNFHRGCSLCLQLGSHLLLAGSFSSFGPLLSEKPPRMWNTCGSHENILRCPTAQGVQQRPLMYFSIHCRLHQSQASPARASPSWWLSSADTWRQTHSWETPDSPDNHLWDGDGFAIS